MAREALIVGGPNGAGKSTFAAEYLSAEPRRFHNADEVAASLAPDDPQSVRIEAGRRFLRNIGESIDRGEDMMIESTLSGRTFRRTIDKLKAAGYRVKLVFIFIDSPQMSVQRVRQRVRRGGHNVPAEDLLRRFNRSKNNFWNLYKGRADTWTLIYNGKERVKVAAGEGDGGRVCQPDLFNRFMRGVETTQKRR